MTRTSRPAAPAARGLGLRPRARKLAAVAWAAFLGAAGTLMALLLAPEDLLIAPLTLGRLAVVFLAAWLLALIPAVFAMALADANPDVPSRPIDSRDD